MAGYSITISGPPAGVSGFQAVTVGPFTVTGTINPIIANANITGSGTTTVAVPTGAVGVYIAPPSTNTNTLKYRDNNTDTVGSFIPKTTGSVWFFDTANAPANVYLTAGGSVGEVEILFF